MRQPNYPGAQQTLNNYGTGNIAEVKIYNAALSDGDRIAEEMRSTANTGLGRRAPATLLGLTASASNLKSW